MASEYVTITNVSVNDAVTVSAGKRKAGSPVNIRVSTAPAIPGGDSTHRSLDLTTALAVEKAMPKIRKALADAAK